MPTERCLIISCEHGGFEVPADYAAVFAGQQPLLHSHRGWDPGALQLARQLADAFVAPLYASTTTRLLIDLNRSMGHRQLFSAATRVLSKADQEKIVVRHYCSPTPMRRAISLSTASRCGR